MMGGVAEVEVLTARALEGVRHGFLGRSGGVSTGLAEGLNVGLGAEDEPEAVAENRRRALAAVAPGARLVTVYQVHSPDCVTVAEPWSEHDRPRADALVTDRADFALGIVTADCAPILFADRSAGVIGAAHAGWKGAFAGVAERTLAAMEALGARRANIAAAIGPCIGPQSYEVDEAFRERFLAAEADNAAFFAAGRAGHWQFDLPGYVAGRLERAGLGAIETLGVDTCSQEARFFSYRRSTLHGEPTYGRQISLLALG